MLTSLGSSARILGMARQEIRARYKGVCSYSQCSLNGVILPGQLVTWNRRVSGTLYHAQCFDLWRKGEESSFEAKTPKPRVERESEPEIQTEGLIKKSDIDYSKVREIVSEEVSKQLVDRKALEIEVKAWDGTTRKVGTAHKMFSTLLYYVSQRRNCYLHGPMGVGKSFACAQVAESLGLPYYYISLNPQSPASLLTGFINAHGDYSESLFFRAYRNGGVFCIDELDNASPSLLTTLNSALANGHASFPVGMVERHPDFILVATGNTTGRGGDFQHPERRRIDEATLDRLTFLCFSYDTELEMSLALAQNLEATPWVEWIWNVRAYVENPSNGIRGGIYATQRAILAGSFDLANGPETLTILEIADRVVFKGMDKDTKIKILNACPIPRVNGRRIS